jgi:phospholipid transport system substrate-binding protein
MRNAIITLGAGLALLAAGASAEPWYGYGSAPYGPGYQTMQPREQGPESIVREGIGKLQAFVAGGGGVEPQKALGFIQEEIAPYFDFGYMAEWTAGGYWSQMSDEAKAQLVDRLRDRFLRALAHHVGAYTTPEVRVGSLRPGSSPGEVMVPTLVKPRYGRAGPAMRLSFRFYRGAEGWKIFDVTANNQSAVMYYRQEFAERMRRAAAPQMAPGMRPPMAAPR